MGEQFLLRLSKTANDNIARAADKIGVSKTKLIEEIIRQEFTHGAVEITLLGPPGSSLVGKEFLDAIERNKDRLLGVVRLDSPEASGDWFLMSYGLVMKNSQVVYAAVGTVSTSSQDGLKVYRDIEGKIIQEDIPHVNLPGPVLYQDAPNTNIKYVPVEAMSRAFSYGQQILAGGPQYEWNEKHYHVVPLKDDDYVITCRIDLPEEKKEGYADIWAFRKSEWEKGYLYGMLSVTNNIEVKCMLGLNYEKKSAEVINFLLRERPRNHWVTGLAQEVIKIMEKHCLEQGITYIYGHPTTFAHKNEYVKITAYLELLGYQVDEEIFKKKLEEQVISL